MQTTTIPSAAPLFDPLFRGVFGGVFGGSRLGATALAAAAVLFGAGCDGFVSDVGGKWDDSCEGCTGSGSPAGRGFSDGSTVRRLTLREYQNTVEDLVGMEPDVSSFPEDTSLGGFSTQADALPVTGILTEAYQSSAEALAARVVAERLDAILPCAPPPEAAQEPSADRACAETLLRTFGTRAFRKPLDDAQMERFLAFYDAQVSAGRPFARIIELLLQALLSSPGFVYREITPNEPGAVDSYTIASRLSYFLWETMPDEALFAAAAAGELSTRAQVEAQARRMIRDERARTPLNRFFVEWLEVQTLAASFRDPELFPEYTSATRSAMANQARSFFDRILWDRGASFDALYTSRELLVDDEMASLLELAPPSGDASWVEVDNRAGILTLPAVMAVFAVPRRSDPIRRGVLVRRQLLCQELPDPPAGVVIEPPAVTEPSNIREELSQHAEGTCAGCHSLIDPVGLGFENYDALGRYRTQYADDSPVDARGELLEAEVTGEFDGAVELAGMLASSGEARRCLAEKWFEYGFGRRVAPGDAASIEHAVAQMAANDDSILELVVALTTSEAFLNGEGN